MARARTISRQRLAQAVAADRPVDASEFPERPKTRGDCVAEPRPCPWCHKLVVMVLATQVPAARRAVASNEQADVACPDCGRRVRYKQGGPNEPWSWRQQPEDRPTPALQTAGGREYSRGLSHCRPCVWSGCRHHLYLDVNPGTGSIKLSFPNLEVWELKETCSLDVADQDEHTLEDVGIVLSLTRERVRQIAEKSLGKLKTYGIDLLGREASTTGSVRVYLADLAEADPAGAAAIEVSPEVSPKNGDAQ